MATRLSTAGLARASARRPWVTIGGWLAIIVLAMVSVATGLSSVLTTDVNFVSRPESVRGDELIGERERALERQAGAANPSINETLLITSSAYTVDQPEFQAAVERATADLRGAGDVVASVVNYYEAKAGGSPLADEMVSADRHTTLLPVELKGHYDDAEANLGEYLALVRQQNANGFEAFTVGELSVDEEFNAISESDLAKEIFSLPITLVVLVVVFGALVAAGVPLTLAIVSIIVALGLTALIGQVWELSLYVVNMITVIGLAVGIDYALFIVERYREERRRGVAKMDAIAIAGGTASKAVLFSGLTVVLALTGMFLIPTTIFRSLGMGAILVTIVAVLAMLTLVPALLSLLGDRIDWPRRRRYDAATAEAQRVHDAETIHRGFWGRITRLVMGRPVVSVILAGGFLALLCVPYFDLKTGTAGVESLPDSDTKRAFTILQRDFYAGMLDPVEIVVSGQRSPELDAAIGNLVATLGQDPTFGPLLEEPWREGHDSIAVIRVPLKGDANSQASYDAVERLREQVVPQTFAGVPAEVFVAGETAFNYDFNVLVQDWTPIVFAFVLSLSFILLLVAFRSLVVSIKAIVMNLLSVGAAYGLIVLVFQKGYGHKLLGFNQVPSIEAWVPIFLFCVLFGLSMDYHVFLLSRIREHYDQTHRNTESVAVGLQATARIITGAALIMVVVFGAFATGDLVMFQQMGFGLAVAIILDATVVRSVLVPSAMALLGDANWYLPRWLSWLPDLRVEGTTLPPALSPSESAGD